ncbi:hypothetical protein [Methanoculleus sp.]|uniref:hypothetical protein n=1 Tax=Methanoculleus sp. TaxID=90427 RepID=UPI0025F44DCD|nr:hypothetical protein [Methanoculleus sp.]MCK9317426.1 hypothetical protein [Methanoculleus sp.]MDD2787812.1 hypothetical protein [Methanoculleus sp.]MDD3215388.1 hypothetical protein [Methanoculleus sp.]MDD4315228.1 hypothetical protein [Methanoculleus sp.]MDD4469990.1 hypothetical protein [Methanoculleus sp.]
MDHGIGDRREVSGVVPPYPSPRNAPIRCFLRGPVVFSLILLIVAAGPGPQG